MPCLSPPSFARAVWTLGALGVLGCGEHKITSHNSEPEASITDPTAGDSLVENIPYQLLGRVDDNDEAAENLVTYWRIGTRDACTDVIPSADGSTTCWATLHADDHSGGEVKISLTVVDSRGASTTDNVSVEAVPNQPPEAEILEPAQGEESPRRYYADQPIDLVGRVSDLEDGLGELTIGWESTIDGVLPLDINVEADGTIRNTTFLSQGNQMLTLRATDLGGLTTSDQVLIAVVGPNVAPSCSITIPMDGAVIHEDDEVTFSGAASDPNEEDLSGLTCTWESSRDGVIYTGSPDSSGLMTFGVSDLTPGDHVIHLTVTDDGELSCADTLSLSVRANPYILGTAPADGDVFTEGEPVTLTAQVADIETLPSDLVVGWMSSLDGALGDTTADSLGYAELEAIDLTPGVHTITTTVTDEDGMTAEVVTTLVINQPPTRPDVSLTPSAPTTADDLAAVLVVDSFDPEGAAVTYEYSWSVDGSLSLVSTSAALPSTATRKGQVWTVTVRASDGDTYGPSATASVSILNSPPTLSAVEITPSSPLSTDGLTCTTAGASDADGDTVSLVTSWAIDGVDTATSDTTLPASDHEPGDTITCTVVPQDDEDSGLPTTAAAVTVNTPPVVHSVSISPAEPSVSDTLICDVGLITDADSDPTTHTVGWSVNGIDVGVAEPSLEASWFARGDEVQCVVTPHDGREPGLERISAEVVIQNSLPLITEVALSPLTATTNTRLNADVAAFDADADTLTLEFTWFVNGDPVTETSASLDGLVYFSRDDEVHLSVTAFDGFGISAPLETTPIVIGNSVPSAPTLRITPEEPAAGVESLTCVLDAPAVDDDGDDVAYTFTWLRDGEVFGATTDTTHEGDTVPGHVTWAGEEWTCLVSAADDISTSEEAIDAVVPEWRFTGWGDEPFPVVDGDVHLLGTNSLAAAGRAIATAGDIDGDGMLDMLIGAPQDDSRAGSSGRAYLALSSHFVGSSTATLNDAYRIIEGSAGDDHVGSSVAGGLDLAGSEAPDIVIGAYGADIMATDDGAVAVFWDGGPASPELLTFDDADVLLHGEIENEIAGVSMHVLEDMDGDGSHELLVGAPHNNTGGHRSGTAYLVLGSTMTTSGTLDLGEQTKLYGESGLDIAGTSVHSAGDLDMDGIPDIVVSAPYNETGGARAGRVYVVYGNDALTYSSLTLGDADIRIHGAAAYDEAGLGLAGGHDVDGDGSPELLIGAPYHDDPAEDAGRAYLFWGAGLAALETRSVEEADVVFTSEEPGSELGFSISSSSDVDADGLHEVVIGVPVGTGDTVGAGVTLLFMGEWLAAGGVFSPGDASYTFVGTGGNDHAGRVVLGTGDVDGDGFDDLAISEPFDTTIYGSKSGAVHLLFAP